MIEIAPRSMNDDMTYEGAILYCTFCTHNGHTDWRMPTGDEYIEYLGISGWYVGRDTFMYHAWHVTPVRDV